MQTEIEQLFDHKPPTYTPEHFDLFYQFKRKLNLGEVRAAEPDASAKNGWRVTPWVKKGILLGFRMGTIVDMSIDRSRQPYLRQGHFPGEAVQPWMTECASCPAGPAFATAALLGAA